MSAVLELSWGSCPEIAPRGEGDCRLPLDLRNGSDADLELVAGRQPALEVRDAQGERVDLGGWSTAAGYTWSVKAGQVLPTEVFLRAARLAPGDYRVRAALSYVVMTGNGIGERGRVETPWRDVRVQ